MAGIAIIWGKKQVGGVEKDVFYTGTIQSDGYAYFNDDKSYRAGQDGSVPQIYYPSKRIWVLTTDFSELHTRFFDANIFENIVNGLVGGSGSVAPNASVESAVQWGVNEVQSRYITYSQSNRWGPNSYDCSSFVITMFRKGGFDVNANSTHDMKAGFTALGFQWLPGSTWPASKLQRGDILLNEGAHTQVYIGNNQDVNCGSTPARIVSHNERYTYNGHNGWDGILRYVGS